MSFKDALELGTAIITSLGGGGALVFGLSGYLGKRWADSALEQEKHKYSELLMTAKSELDRATSRYQVELDKLGLVHKLRTTEEFSHLAMLWKHMAILQSAFNSAVARGLRFVPPDKDEREKFEARLRQDYEKARSEAHRFFLEEKLFIPKAIADSAESTLMQAIREGISYDLFSGHHDHDVRRQYTDNALKFLEDFHGGMIALEVLMRDHIDGRGAS
jgi:hypothetical protein